jgi:hypothetical protein
MAILSFILLAWAGIGQAIMMGIQYRWRGSYWDRRSRKSDWFARWLRDWWSPEAWRNKRKYQGFWGFIMSTILVMFTDGFHFSQWIMFTAYELNIWLWWQPTITGHHWGDMAILLIAMKACRGIPFEILFSFSLYNDLMKKLSGLIRTVATTHGHRLAQVLLLVCFIAGGLIASGDRPISDARVIITILVIAGGMASSIGLWIWSSRSRKS